MSQDEQAIRNLVKTWMEATRERDTDKILSLMTDDVIFTVPDREPFGKEEFKADSEQVKEAKFEGSSEIHEIEVFDQWAYVRNYLSMKITPPNGTPIKRSGYTLTIFRKEADGRWKLCRDANLVTPDQES